MVLFLSRSRDDVPSLFCYRPAPGYRHRDTGALWNVGNSGYSWGSTFDGNNGMHLSFRVTWLHSNDSYHRAYGFQLRCLSE
ncbi:hypothetical protein [uncultured Rikenella sp.]|nr:hypothetical protein [uncultured Rikenella sp.]